MHAKFREFLLNLVEGYAEWGRPGVLLMQVFDRKNPSFSNLEGVVLDVEGKTSVGLES